MLSIQQNKPLSDLTTFGIGGPAKHYVEVKIDEEIHDALDWAREHDVPFFVMGGGSNLLIPDEGFDGLVIDHVAFAVDSRLKRLDGVVAGHLRTQMFCKINARLDCFIGDGRAIGRNQDVLEHVGLRNEPPHYSSFN